MRTTPICDFVRAYAASRPVRLHMPGHKGSGPMGFEALDITEIDGADNLYAPSGIIAESEANASRLFGAQTCYSAEGSSLAIRAMLFLALAGRLPVPPSRESGAGAMGAPSDKKRPAVLAGRNAHRAFLSAAALMDFEVQWLHPDPGQAYHGGCATAEAVEAALTAPRANFVAVYLTSPDYLGNLADLAAIAAACHRHGALLLVDNAHGAYLRFLSPSRHPMDLGADLCCDSAHKTLSAVTGGAYLHANPALGIDPRRVKEALALFGSSSPSWLILQSLDACNPLLEDLPERLAAFLPRLDALKEGLERRGYALAGDEPMKLTLRAKSYGYTGDALAERLEAEGVFCEFHDPDYLTLMPSPANVPEDLDKLEKALASIPRRDPLPDRPPAYHAPRRAMSIRQATFAPSELLPAARCEGRVLAAPAVSCPPCVPIAVCGEVIDARVLERMAYYGIREAWVVRSGRAE